MAARASIKKLLLMDPFGSSEVIRELLGTAQDEFEIIETISTSGHEDAYAIFAGPENPLPEQDVRAMTGLRVVVATSTGFDHIPVEAVSAQGAWTTTTAGYCTEEVAEHAFALLLGGLRRLPQLDAQVRAGEWAVETVAPRRLAGSRVTLIGLGRIAQSLAARLLAVGIDVCAFDPLVPDTVFATVGVKRALTLHEAVADSDALSVHVPLLPETYHLIDAHTLAAMRPGAFIVNVARGGLIDEQALIQAVKTGQLSGAALDVFPTEPLPLEDPLRHAPNLVLGPHGAWYSPNAQRQLFALAVRALLDVRSGAKPAGSVAAPMVAQG